MEGYKRKLSKGNDTVIQIMFSGRSLCTHAEFIFSNIGSLMLLCDILKNLVCFYIICLQAYGTFKIKFN